MNIVCRRCTSIFLVNKLQLSTQCPYCGSTSCDVYITRKDSLEKKKKSIDGVNINDKNFWGRDVEFLFIDGYVEGFEGLY